MCLKSCLMVAKNIHEIYCRSRKFVPSYINVRSTGKKLHEFGLQLSFRTRNKIPRNGEIKLIL